MIFCTQDRPLSYNSHLLFLLVPKHIYLLRKKSRKTLLANFSFYSLWQELRILQSLPTTAFEFDTLFHSFLLLDFIWNPGWALFEKSWWLQVSYCFLGFGLFYCHWPIVWNRQRQQASDLWNSKLCNLVTSPKLTFHLKLTVQLDLIKLSKVSFNYIVVFVIS